MLAVDACFALQWRALGFPHREDQSVWYRRGAMLYYEAGAIFLNDWLFEVLRVGLTRNIVFNAGGVAFGVYTTFARLRRWL